MQKLKKYIIILITIAAVLLGLAFYWLNLSPPDKVNAGENALATKDVVVIGHLNNNKIKHIVGNVAQDPKSLDLPLVSTDIFNELYNGKANLKDTVEHLTFAINVGKKSATSVMLHGNFAWDVINESINKFYIVEPLQDKTYKLIKREDKNVFYCPDELAAQTTPEEYIYVNEQYLIFATNLPRLNTITKRLHSKVAAEVDLSNWRQYRNSKILSAGVIIPKQTAKATKGMTAHIMNKVATENEEVSALFFGAQINLLSQTLSLQSHIDATNDWATAKNNAAQAYLAELKSAASSVSKTLSGLVNNIEVQAQNSQLISTITLSKNDIPKLSDVFSEILTQIFSNGSAHSSSQSQQLVAESLMTNVWDYQNNNKLINLPTYQQAKFDAKPSSVNGPLAILVNSVQQNKELGLLELSVEGVMNTPKIDGWWHNSNINLTLKINAVNDINGVNLLRDERCVKDLGYKEGNHEASSGFSASNQKASLTKTLRLTQGTKYSDINLIEGTFALSAPVNVKSIDLPLTPGTEFQQHGVRFYISKFDRQSLTYQVSGAKEKLLQVYGVNAKGQLLSQNYSWGSGDSKTQYYKGDIKSVRIMVASKTVNHVMNFSIDQSKFFAKTPLKVNYLTARPTTVSTNAWSKATNKKWQKSEASAYLAKDKYRLKTKVGEWYQYPFAMMLNHNNRQSWVQTPTLTILSPMVSELSFNLQAYQLSFAANNKANATYVKYSPWYRIKNDYITESLPHDKIAETGIVSETVSLDIKLAAKEKLDKLTGELKINLPTSIETVNVGLPKFEQTQHSADISVSMISILNSSTPKATYKVKAPNLINMIAVLKNGKEFRPEQGSQYKAGYWQLTFPLTEQIDHFELITASALNTLSYPFEITPSYPQ